MEAIDESESKVDKESIASHTAREGQPATGATTEPAAAAVNVSP